MLKNSISTFDLYKDISQRTNGEIYIGVVGPVRTGKSTFIKRFMDLLVLPNIEDENVRARTKDELPQSGNGKIIMTTEPKFVPDEAVEISMDEDVSVKVRLIDCVGFVVEGALGIVEDYKERMVKTPWFDEEIPFTRAAHIGTKKVIEEHSTIGIVVTTDGSFGELVRSSYLEAEEQAISELKRIGKPFIVLLNTIKPYAKETIELAGELSEKYGVRVLPCNCEQLRIEDITDILKNVLYEFPISEISFYMPKWVEMLEQDNPILHEVIEQSRKMLQAYNTINDIKPPNIEECEYIEDVDIKNISLSNGNISIEYKLYEKYYYETISSLTGSNIANEYDLVSVLWELSSKRELFEKVGMAIENVKSNGYGFVTAGRDEISFDEPQVIKNGNKYGVKITAKAPSIHLINTSLETEIAPIVGSKEQAEDLIRYIEAESNKEGGIWETNIFGKTIAQIVEDGIEDKIHNMSQGNVEKIRDTLQKVMNENNGLICLIV